MIPQSHPYWYVKALIERRNDVVSVHASFYSYRPQTVDDHRTTFEIGTQDFVDPQQMARLLDSVPANHELALHSNLRLTGNRTAHIVMVDMSTASRAHLSKLRVFLGDNFFHQIAWFFSGRSFHGYGESLLEHEEWVKFMGLLLLANQPRLAPAVDPRWIGHRLMAGYASLRWTCKTSHYLSLPKAVAPPAKTSSNYLEVGSIGSKVGRFAKLR